MTSPRQNDMRILASTGICSRHMYVHDMVNTPISVNEVQGYDSVLERDLAEVVVAALTVDGGYRPAMS